MTTTLYKGFTHDLRPPIQGGEPVWDGTLPYVLPRVAVDKSSQECAAGWNACRTVVQVLEAAGMWSNGWALRVVRMETDEAVVERGRKCRVATGTLIEEVAEAVVTEAVREFTTPWAGDLTEEMIVEQTAWRSALGRSGPRDEAAVEAGLRTALVARGLGTWELRRHPNAKAAWNAWAAGDAKAAWAARDAWDVWAARADKAAWAVGDAGDVWAAWAAKAAWAAWAARDARDALQGYFAARKGWISRKPDLFAVGLRDAYYHGLDLAVPVAKGVFGWTLTRT
jgi:hypothetical protein